jgi:Putative restriction endonuclease
MSAFGTGPSGNASGAGEGGAVLDHEGPWSESAYLELPSGDGRVELADGALLVGPGTTVGRGRAVEQVRAAVAGALPDGLRVIGPVPLRLGRDCLLVPDLVVTRAPGEPAVLDAEDALMILEVVGVEHGAVDRAFKPQLYARSGIPYSVLVDHHAPFAAASMIIGGRYHEYARTEGGTVLRIEDPFRLEVDLAAVDHDHDEVRAAG